MESTEQITQDTQTEQNQQTHQNHQPDLGRQTSQTNQSDRKDQQASHPQAGHAPLADAPASTARWVNPQLSTVTRQSPSAAGGVSVQTGSNMDPHNVMDLTAYLQTEGRRRAAELAGSRHSGDPGLSAPCSQAQQQCATTVDDPQPPQCLSEALRRMGVT